MTLSESPQALQFIVGQNGETTAVVQAIPVWGKIVTLLKDNDDFMGDEKWDQWLAQSDPRQLLHEMAREAYEDYQAERTSDIAITEDGRLAPA